MNLLSLTMPEAGPDLIPWLEEQIVGLQLGELVAELAAVHDVDGPPDDSVASILGRDALKQVLTQGLKVLPKAVLKKLVTQPYYLLEIQQIVLTQGGPHWTRLPRSESLQQAVATSWELLQTKLTERATPEGKNVTKPTPWAMPAKTRAWYRRPWPWIVNFATAAAVFAAVYFAHRVPHGGSGNSQPTLVKHSGLLKSDELSKNLPVPEYFDSFATLTEDELTEMKRAESAHALDQRIKGVLAGCALLQSLNDSRLGPQKAWLADKCSSWTREFKKDLTELEAGHDVVKVRQNVLATLQKMATAFRLKAADLRQAMNS